jgi:hypothetical protein
VLLFSSQRAILQVRRSNLQVGQSCSFRLYYGWFDRRSSVLSILVSLNTHSDKYSSSFIHLSNALILKTYLPREIFMVSAQHLGEFCKDINMRENI